jgi:hypothetical protein
LSRLLPWSRRDPTRIARRFNAGIEHQTSASPAGTAETGVLTQRDGELSRPCGTRSSWDRYPALKRRAILDCSFGTNARYGNALQNFEPRHFRLYLGLRAFILSRNASLK